MLFVLLLPFSQPLVDAAGQLHASRTAAEGTKGAQDLEGLGDAAAAQRFVHQHMVDAGASLQQLQMLRQGLAT
jgi:hypothetical protein